MAVAESWLLPLEDDDVPGTVEVVDALGVVDVLECGVVELDALAFETVSASGRATVSGCEAGEESCSAERGVLADDGCDEVSLAWVDVSLVELVVAADVSGDC